jgi:hypothetical protein
VSAIEILVSPAYQSCDSTGSQPIALAANFRQNVVRGSLRSVRELSFHFVLPDDLSILDTDAKALLRRRFVGEQLANLANKSTVFKHESHLGVQ